MLNYFRTDRIIIKDFSDENIEDLYEKGYVFTRVGKGVMDQTRSLRIRLNGFELSSENRRVIKNTPDLTMEELELPLIEMYDWHMARLAKEFYEKRFGVKIFGANKARELITINEKSNFNVLLKYIVKNKLLGYCICYASKNLLHYVYPFYKYDEFPNNYGMGMLLMAIQNARVNGKKYFYIGSYTRPEDKYKLQFKGLEWFDGNTWSTDLEELKSIELKEN